jgi:uncharacterized protein YbgA (DUF1722 family)/uncharacterized protein YbbK (DUF523 family)
MIPIGISGCVLGQNVRFDGGHKQNRFVVEELIKLFDFQSICPEMGIGLGTPRATIRLVDHDGEHRLVGSRNADFDVTEEMRAFSQRAIAEMQTLCGFIVCGKSPTCGMERVPVYARENNRSEKKGVGLFTVELIKAMPWLPIEESGRLQDVPLRENFIQRVYALNDFYQRISRDSDVNDFVRFHARYKYAMMAANGSQATELGRKVAALRKVNVSTFYDEYRYKFMSILRQVATRKTHTNTLMHLQGYFKSVLNQEERAELTHLIEQYRLGEVPMMAVLTMLKHYLNKYPNAYLEEQTYFQPHPSTLKLRLGL